jgi:hypothetical protein
MKKNKLIEILQNIKGNPDIKVWNGYAEDWQNFDLIEQELVKETEEFIRSRIEADWKVTNKNEIIPEEVQKELDKIITRQLKAREWEFANPYVSGERDKIWYGKNRKKVFLINAKARGKTTFDRLGDIDY